MQKTIGNVRISVITDSVVRIEYYPVGMFIDEETLFAQNRTCKAKTVQYIQTENKHEFITDYFHLTYIDDGKPLSKENLYASIGSELWYYGKENKNNLGGTLPTLDGIHPDKPVEDGLLSRDGWAVIEDTDKPVLKDGWIAKQPLYENIDLYLFAYGHDYKLALRDLCYISGKAALPRKYVFGSWYSRWSPYTSEEIKGIVKGYDDHDFPLDIMVIDMDWHYNDWQIKTPEEEQHRATYGYGHANNLGWTGYTWNRRLIPDPERLLKELHDDRIYVTLNDHPHDGIRSHEEQYADFAALMGFPPESGLNLEFDCGDKKYMQCFFKAVHEKLEKQGVDFWWVDWQQDHLKPYVKGIRKLRHLPWLNRCYYEHAKENGKRGLSFSRWGGWGDQKHPIQFSGDTTASWEVFDYEVRFTISSSNAGCFYWGHDTGGFCGERNWEMYVRWTQFTAFSACLRVHSEVVEELDKRPWLWGDTAEKAMRAMYHLRSELIPYIYSSAYEATEQSLPLIRGMYLEFPEDENAYRFPQQYMFGDAFIVSPVTQPGEGEAKTVSKKVWVKGGTYYDIFSGKRYEDGTVAEIESDIYTFPVLAKGGVPIPMQPYSRRMTSEPLSTLRIRIYPGESGEFVLYEDDGISEAYQNGACLKTRLHYEKKGNEITVTAAPEGKPFEGLPEKRRYVIELPLTGTLQTDDPAAELHTENGVNTVHLTERDVFEGFTVKLTEQI